MELLARRVLGLLKWTSLSFLRRGVSDGVVGPPLLDPASVISLLCPWIKRIPHVECGLVQRIVSPTCSFTNPMRNVSFRGDVSRFVHLSGRVSLFSSSASLAHYSTSHGQGSKYSISKVLK